MRLPQSIRGGYAAIPLLFPGVSNAEFNEALVLADRAQA